MNDSVNWRQYWLFGGPILALFTGGFLWGALPVAAVITAAITVWTVVWWITEPIPIPVTSLLPLALFPLVGVLEASQVAAAYGSPLILLMLGGFLLSKGMESTGTHQRLALYMVRACQRVSLQFSKITSGTHSDDTAVGQSDVSLVVGFMLASALLSMWISNTATTLMLLPIALAILEKSDNPKLPLAIMLGVAYAANVGGMGTPIGTPPNLVFMEVYAEVTGEKMGFLQWMKIGVPVVLVFVPIIAWWLTRGLAESQGKPLELPQVGEWRVAEKRVLGVFALTACAWITRSEPFGGWSGWLDLSTVNDASIALLGAIALFIIPDGKGQRLLDWSETRDLPWGVLLLFAGGICIAKAFSVSGLSAALGDAMGALASLPLILLIFSICVLVSFLTESTSNMATTALLMPILAAAALGAHIDPQLLMIPAALSASCAFMLPVATAPNAIVFGSGKVRSVDMLRKGFVLNWIGAVIISLFCFWIL